MTSFFDVYDFERLLDAQMYSNLAGRKTQGY